MEGHDDIVGHFDIVYGPLGHIDILGQFNLVSARKITVIV